MIIFSDRIFILIPKNGCNSIMREYGVNAWTPHRGNVHEALLYVDGDHCHLPAASVPKRFKLLPTFAIVRNPWDRTVSRYVYNKRTKNMDISFEDFVEQRYVDKKYANDPGYAKWGPVAWTEQIEWLNDDTVVYKFDEYDFKFRDNVSVRDDHKSYYNKRTADLVGDYYINDIKRFNFAKPVL